MTLASKDDVSAETAISLKETDLSTSNKIHRDWLQLLVIPSLLCLLGGLVSEVIQHTVEQTSEDRNGVRLSDRLPKRSDKMRIFPLTMSAALAFAFQVAAIY